MRTRKAFTDAIEKVLKIATDHGKPAGMWCNVESAVWAVKKGFRRNTVLNADMMLGYGAAAALKAGRGN